MKTVINSIACLVLVGIFAACNQTGIIPEEENPTPGHGDLGETNFISATIDGTDWIAYQSDSLNTTYQDDFFFFEFGKMITTGNSKSDTCMFIQGSINHQSVRLVFPFPKSTGTFDIMSYNSLSKHPSANYQNNQKRVHDKFHEVYYTQNPFANTDIMLTKTGSITITRFDAKKHTVSGTFKFNAFGYYIDEEDYFRSSGNSVSISNGKFNYHWEQDFE